MDKYCCLFVPAKLPPALFGEEAHKPVIDKRHGFMGAISNLTVPGDDNLAIEGGVDIRPMLVRSFRGYEFADVKKLESLVTIEAVQRLNQTL